MPDEIPSLSKSRGFRYSVRVIPVSRSTIAPSTNEPGLSYWNALPSGADVSVVSKYCLTRSGVRALNQFIARFGVLIMSIWRIVCSAIFGSLMPFVSSGKYFPIWSSSLTSPSVTANPTASETMLLLCEYSRCRKSGVKGG